jgi:hypothetical protein
MTRASAKNTIAAYLTIAATFLQVGGVASVWVASPTRVRRARHGLSISAVEEDLSIPGHSVEGRSWSVHRSWTEVGAARHRREGRTTVRVAGPGIHSGQVVGDVRRNFGFGSTLRLARKRLEHSTVSWPGPETGDELMRPARKQRCQRRLQPSAASYRMTPAGTWPSTVALVVLRHLRNSGIATQRLGRGGHRRSTRFVSKVPSVAPPRGRHER